MSTLRNSWLRFIPLGLIIIAFAAFFYFHLYRYLSFAALKTYHNTLLTWTKQHYWLAVIIYIIAYIIAIAASVPGAIFLTMTGGFLFGLVWGTLYAVLAATIGSLLLFLAVQTAFGAQLSKKANTWLAKLEQGFQKNAFNYLLSLRLVPICPFWAVNIVAAVLNMRLRDFFWATFIGIIPGAFVYISLGHGLEQVFAKNSTPNLGIIFKPYILFPLCALALLSLLPIFYKQLKRKFQ